MISFHFFTLTEGIKAPARYPYLLLGCLKQLIIGANFLTNADDYSINVTVLQPKIWGSGRQKALHYLELSSNNIELEAHI